MAFRRNPLVVLFVAVAVCGPAATPAQADRAVAQLDRSSPIAALGGVVAWSAADSPTGAFRLMLRRSGTVIPAAIAAAPLPFDVSLGRDAAGRLVALYRRCARTRASGPTGCDVYRYDVAARREEHVGEVSRPDRDEGWPVQSGSRIAFVALRAAGGPGGRRCDVPYVTTLGVVVRTRRLDAGRCATTVGLSLRGERIVQLTSGPTSEGSPTELRRLEARGRRMRLLARISDRDGGGHDRYTGTPSQSSAAVYVLRSTQYGERFVRIGLRSGRRSEVPAHTDLEGAFARDERGTSWYVESPAAFDCSYAPSPDVPCRLVQTSADPFSSTTRRLAPRLQIARGGGQDPSAVSGRLDQAVVRGRLVERREPLAAVGVALFARPAGSLASRFADTGLRVTTGTDGRFSVRATGQPNGSEYLAVTLGSGVATYATEPLIGPEPVDWL